MGIDKKIIGGRCISTREAPKSKIEYEQHLLKLWSEATVDYLNAVSNKFNRLFLELKAGERYIKAKLRANLAEDPDSAYSIDWSRKAYEAQLYETRTFLTRISDWSQRAVSEGYSVDLHSALTGIGYTRVPEDDQVIEYFQDALCDACKTERGPVILPLAACADSELNVATPVTLSEFISARELRILYGKILWKLMDDARCSAEDRQFILPNIDAILDCLEAGFAVNGGRSPVIICGMEFNAGVNMAMHRDPLLASIKSMRRWVCNERRTALLAFVSTL